MLAGSIRAFVSYELQMTLQFIQNNALRARKVQNRKKLIFIILLKIKKKCQK